MYKAYLIKSPSGKYIFVGSIPVELSKIACDNITEAKIEASKINFSDYVIRVFS